MLKRIVIALTMFWMMGICAQAQITKSNSWISAAADTKVPLINTGVYNHRITWTGKGTRTSCTIKLEQSLDGTTFTDLIGAASCTTNGTLTATGYVNYVRINVTVLTGSGNTIYATYNGANVISSLSAVNISDGAGNSLTSGAYGLARALHVALVDASGNQIVSFGGGVQFVTGADIGTGTGTISHGSTTTAHPTYVTGKVNPLSLDTNGLLRTGIFDASGAQITSFGGGTQFASGAAISTGTGTIAHTSTTTAAPTYTTGTVNPLSTTTAGDLRTVFSNTSIGVTPSTADSADGAAMTNNPTPITGKLNTDGSKAAMPAYTVGGAGFSLPWTATAALVKGAITTAMTATTSTQVIAAVTSNYIYVTSCSFANDHASVSTLMKLQDGSGGTVLWEGMVPFGGGNNVTFPTPLKVTTAGNGLYVVNVTTGSSTYASCSGWASTVSF